MRGDFYFRTDRLTVGYDGRPLIRDIEIGLDRGQILTLIGPNGSGKTTILRSMAKYIKPLHGTVYLDRRSLEEMTNRDISHKLAVVLTERLKTELMSCGDVVATGRYPYTGPMGILSERDRQRTREAMELVDILELKDRDFTRISDGQRQRVLLARAICQEPEIILLDEPTSFLDIRYQLELLDILRNMARTRNIGIIMSMHELDLAQKISDMVLCVKGERIAHYGPPEEIFRKDLIRSLYGMTEGSYNPLFGSVEMGKPRGVPEIFVIAGGGTGIEVFRGLQKRGRPFVAGILHENDIDYHLAMELAGEVIGERGFSPIREETLERALLRLSSCSTLINCLQGYGEVNAMNRLLAEEAAARGMRIITGLKDLP